MPTWPGGWSVSAGLVFFVREGTYAVGPGVLGQGAVDEAELVAYAVGRSGLGLLGVRDLAAGWHGSATTSSTTVFFVVALFSGDAGGEGSALLFFCHFPFCCLWGIEGVVASWKKVV